MTNEVPDTMSGGLDTTRPAAPSTKPRVLVVDDDPGICEAVRELLTGEGYRVIEATNGVEALVLLRAAPDRLIVILDWQMPQLDGAGVLGAVAADRVLAQQHAYLFLTAGMQTLRLPFAQLLTALDVTVLHKPFDVDDLLTLVARLAQRLVQP